MSTQQPNFDLTYGFQSGENGWGQAFNDNFKKISGLINLTIIDFVVSNPLTATIGDRYINTVSQKILVCNVVNTFDEYSFKSGIIFLNKTKGKFYYINDSLSIEALINFDISNYITKTEIENFTGNVLYDLGGWVNSLNPFNLGGSTNPTAVYYMPFMLKAGTLTKARIKVATAGSAGKIAHIGLYDIDPLTNKPRNLLISGTVATDSVGIKEISGSIVIPNDGLYYVAVKQDIGGTIAYFNGTMAVTSSNFESTNVLDYNSILTAKVVGYHEATTGLPAVATPSEALNTLSPPQQIYVSVSY